MRKDFGKTNWLVPQPVMIVTSYDERGIPNAMNAAWGGIYDEHKVMICLATDHKTTMNLYHTNEFAICFPTSKHVVEADYVGIVSGNEVRNKFDKLNLTITKSKLVNAPIIEEFPIALECRISSIQEVDVGTTIVIGDVLNTSVDKSMLDYSGKVDSEKFDFIAYDPINHKYRKIGKEIADAFICGLEIK